MPALLARVAFRQLMREGHPTQWPAFGPARNISEHSASDSCFRLIENWIQECIESHPSCALLTSRSLPTQVIDVRTAGEEPRLYVTHRENASYMALSHCWGHTPIIRTTKATFELWKEGIPWPLLSKTFQDALLITRKLGMQYLWIDSSCIIQDDRLDWELESAQMGTIYPNSYLTIAATRSADGDGGCFLTRPDFSTSSLELTHDGSSKIPSSVFVRQEFPFHTVHSPFHKDMSKFPLHARAWAFQECILATRVVQYAEDELSWECKSRTRCECTMLDRSNDTNLKSRYQSSLAGSYAVKTELWAEVVNRFTERQLFHESDRLPTISGIAKQLQSHETGPYLAGIWKHDFPRGLLWHIEDTQNARKPLAFRAPSWSWASVEGGLVWHTFGGKLSRNARSSRTHIRLLDVQCTASGADSTGEVSRGFLKVAGPLQAATLCCCERPSVLDQIEVAGLQLEYQPDVPITINSVGSVSCLQISTVDYGFQPPLPLNYQETESLVLT